MALNLKHQTAAQFAARLRERYRNATREEAGKIAAWVVAKLAAGDITDAQMKAAFGLNTAQYTALKTRMNALADSYNALQTAKGE